MTYKINVQIPSLPESPKVIHQLLDEAISECPDLFGMRVDSRKTGLTISRSLADRLSDGRIVASYSELASDTGYSRRMVIDVVKNLEGSGLLHRENERQGNSGNRYSFPGLARFEAPASDPAPLEDNSALQGEEPALLEVETSPPAGLSRRPRRPVRSHRRSGRPVTMDALDLDELFPELPDEPETVRVQVAA